MSVYSCTKYNALTQTLDWMYIHAVLNKLLALHLHMYAFPV